MATETIQKNMLVEFTYSITDELGNVIEQIDQPVSHIHKKGQSVHPKIESALEGRCEGDSFSVSLEQNEGFGAPNPELIFVDHLANVPPEFHEIGAEIKFQNKQGEDKIFRVTNIKDGKITVDGNHPLAGRSLTFHLKVLQVRRPSKAELSGQNIMGDTANPPTNTPPTLN